MKVYLYLISFILCYYQAELAQPYFPNQIVFSFENSSAIIAIDEVNQRAYQSFPSYPSMSQTSYAMKAFSYAPAGTPQSKYYVQLLNDSASPECMFETYWKYAASHMNAFPPHWLINETTFEIKNYVNFSYEMIHSSQSSPDEDYWYSKEECEIDTDAMVPCDEIYFKKNTEIPLRQTKVVYRGFRFVQRTTVFRVISIGKPDEKYFESVSKDWYNTCPDLNLELIYQPQFAKIDFNKSLEIHVSLAAPPHRINGNDTVQIRWNSTECNGCFILSPNELHFNGDNFHQKQILTITRVKDAPQKAIYPILNGGGFDILRPTLFPIYIE